MIIITIIVIVQSRHVPACLAFVSYKGYYNRMHSGAKQYVLLVYIFLNMYTLQMDQQKVDINMLFRTRQTDRINNLVDR